MQLKTFLTIRMKALLQNLNLIHLNLIIRFNNFFYFIGFAATILLTPNFFYFFTGKNGLSYSLIYYIMNFANVLHKVTSITWLNWIFLNHLLKMTWAFFAWKVLSKKSNKSTYFLLFLSGRTFWDISWI